MRTLLTILILTIVYQVSYSNGGPIDGSFVQKSGNIKLINRNDIEIIREDLRIEIAGDYCNVHVIYTFKNHGSESNVKYGFPVDFIPSDGYYFPATEGYVQNFQYLINNQSLKYSTLLEDNVPVDKVISNFYLGNPTGGGFKVSRRWYITDLHFDSNSIQELQVKYRIKSNFGKYPAGGLENFFSIYSKMIFIYDLKPAGFWGEGIIKEFNLTIKKTKNLSLDEIEITGIDSLNYNNEVFSVQILDFQASNADALNISWDSSSSLMKGELANSLPNSIIKNIKTSSQLKGNYAPENLIDKKYNTAWVEGVEGSGIGEWIEFEFNENVLITGMSFLNGYTKSQSTFSNNNKVKSYGIHVFNKQGGSVTEWPHFGRRVLKNRTYEEINDYTYFSMLDIIMDAGNSGNYFGVVTTKIRFTIYDVFKGTLYDDTCISEFLFYGLRK